MRRSNYINNRGNKKQAGKILWGLTGEQLYNNARGHLKVVLRHKWEVMKGCFRVGLFRQGLLHDLSKFSPEEFLVGVRYFQGNRSPNAAEREKDGYSRAWLHHKGRNKHHFEYWQDVEPGGSVLRGVEMPPRYFAEMIMDRIAASKIYNGEAYTNDMPLRYLLKGHEKVMMNPVTYKHLIYVMTMLAERGEKETFRYIRRKVLNKRW